MKGTRAALAFLLCVTSRFALAEAIDKDEPKFRAFRFEYGARVQDLEPGVAVRIWIPVPQTNEHQSVQELASDLPQAAKSSVEPKFGNRILYLEISAPDTGVITFRTSYRVRRMEVRGLQQKAAPGRLSPRQRDLYLSASRKVPLVGEHLRLLNGIEHQPDPLDVARALYDRVDAHVRYDKSRPGYGRGDVLWVCDSRFGNCTDFHSLFISLARAMDLSARFEIGFPLPTERGRGSIKGYHCWAMFHTDAHGWVPVDISEADKYPTLKEYYFGNLTENRITFTTGRDIELVPRQASGPLNYFVYPHIEVDGKVWPQKHTELSFHFQDLPPHAEGE